MAKHKHHILPKHMGGSSDPPNIVELSVEEHAEEHRKLWLENGSYKDFLAWQGLSKMIGKEELIRELISHTHKGKKKPPEQIIKMVEARKGYSPSEETRKKIGESSRGRKWSKESRQKKSESMKGNTHRKGGPPTLGFTGRKHSEETREKMKLAQQKRRMKFDD
jgi:hypothetical protein